MASELKTSVLADNFRTWWNGRFWNWEPEGNRNKKYVTAGIDGKDPPDAVLVSSATSQTLPSSAPTECPTNIAPYICYPSSYFSLRPSIKGGIGAFASQDIPKGTALFQEGALFQSTDCSEMIMDEFAKLSTDNQEKFLALHSYDALDDDNEVACIFRVNRFRTSSSLSGIFLVSSRFNHACSPTTTYRFNALTGKLEFTTIQDIANNQEITISYGHESCDLALNYGFLCDCGHCVPPKTIPRWKSKW